MAMNLHVKRWLWFVALWVISVALLGSVAALIRSVLL